MAVSRQDDDVPVVHWTFFAFFHIEDHLSLVFCHDPGDGCDLSIHALDSLVLQLFHVHSVQDGHTAWIARVFLRRCAVEFSVLVVVVHHRFKDGVDCSRHITLASKIAVEVDLLALRFLFLLI